MVRRIGLLVVGLWLATDVASAQVTRSQRVAASERVVIGTNSFGTTSPLQIVGLPPRAGETACVWVDGSGNFKSGACGTVTNVGLTMPGLFSVSGSPVTTSGTLAVSLVSQAANRIFASPDGSSGTPTFRQVAPGDVSSGLYGINISGNAATATALAANPANCAANLAARGIAASGAAEDCWEPVRSVALTAPAELSVSGSPVTTAGTLGLAWASAAANSVFQRAGTSGTPSFSTSLTLGGVLSVQGHTTLGDATSDTLTVTARLASGLTWGTDNTYDVGASGVNRPRDLFLARNATVGGTLGVAGVATFSSSAQASGWASRTSGWGITNTGSGDFRDLFSDNLSVKTFTSELTQAVNGSMLWTKSVSEVAGESTLGGAVTCPTAGGASETWWFRDAPGGANLRIFQAGDAVSLRVVSWADAGSDGASELSVSDCIVTVSSYADGTAGNDGYQSWSVTRPASGGGGMANGGAVPLKTQALNFGVTADGFLLATVSDGTNNTNAPYFGVQTWATTPAAANWTTRARLGQLRGITSTDEYGLLAGTYAATDGRFFRASDTNFDLHGIDLTIWDGATAAILLRRNSGAPYLSIGAPAPSTYASGEGFWVGDDGGTYKFRVGNPGGNLMAYDSGTDTLSVTGTVTAGAGTIGGFTVNSTEGLYAGSGTTRVQMKPGAGFWAGADARDSAPFRVTQEGALVATSAAITGTITGGTVQTYANCGAAGVGCVEMESNVLRWYNASNQQLGSLSGSGIRILPSTGLDWSRSITFATSGGGADFGLYGYESGSTQVTGVGAGPTTGGWASQVFVEAASPGYDARLSLIANASMGSATLWGETTVSVRRGTAGFEQTVIQGNSSGWSAGQQAIQVSGWSASDVLQLDPFAARGVVIGATSLTSGYRLDVNGAVYSRGSLRVGTDLYIADNDTGTSPGMPWMRSNGLHLVINSHSPGGLYLNWDNGGQQVNTGGALQVGTSLYLAGASTNKIWSVNSSGIAIDATNSGGNPSFLNYRASTFLNETLYLGYTNGGTTTLTTYYSSQNMEIVPTGALYINPGGTARVYFTDTDIQVNGVYNNAGSWLASGGSTTLCDNGGWIYRCTSSARWKTNIATAVADWSRILDVRPVFYDEIVTEHNPDPARGIFGAIAEEFDALGLQPLVGYDKEGLPESVRYERVALYLIPLVREQRAQIASLETRLAALEVQVAATTPRLGPDAIHPLLDMPYPGVLHQSCTTGIPPVCGPVH